METVYLPGTPAGSLDGAFGYLAQQAGGTLAGSVSLPNTGNLPPNEALTLGLLAGKVPYRGSSTVLVAVAPGNFTPYHELLSVAGGQVPVEVVSGNGDPFPGASFDFTALVDGYFGSDPPAPYFAATENVPGLGQQSVDYVTGNPPPGPGNQGQLKAPNIAAADLFFAWLVETASGK